MWSRVRGSETDMEQTTWDGLHGEQGEKVRQRERARYVGWAAPGAGRAGQ